MMKQKIFSLLLILILNLPLLAQEHIRKTWEGTYRHNQRLGRHYINTDSAGNILPWFRPDIGISFDYVLNRLWEFWDSMPYVFDGTRYYMVHREWPWNKEYPGNSHTSRYAYLELLYSQMTGDWSRKVNSIRQLIWATYSVDTEGRNEYPGDPATNEIWFTDGYGDYVAHYLNAMAVLPQELASPEKDRMLGCLSVIRNIHYSESEISYETDDSNSTEVLRFTSKPREIFVNGNMLKESNLPGNNSYVWQPLEKGGILYVVHGDGNNVKILK